MSATLDAVKTSRGIQLWWRLQGSERLELLELRRRTDEAAETVVESWTDHVPPAGTFLDTPEFSGAWLYRLIGRVEGEEIASPEIEVEWDAPSSERVELLGASPNPFNPSTTISFTLPERMHARLDIYDVSGRHVSTLVDGLCPAGLNTVQWTGHDDRGHSVASGSYFSRLATGDGTQTLRLIMVR